MGLLEVTLPLKGLIPLDGLKGWISGMDFSLHRPGARPGERSPGGTGQGQIDPRSLDFNLGRWGIRAGNKSLCLFFLKKAHFLFSSLYFDSVSCTGLLTPEP